MNTADYLTRLMTESGSLELRHQLGDSWNTYWFDDPDQMLTQARRLSREGNLFTSLNRVQSQPSGPLKNDHVQRYTRLLFDFDPVRPVDFPSTNAEMTDAYKRATLVADHLSGHGWPKPAMALSGNGCHLQYRVALPNTPETKKAIRYVYHGLKARFDDDVVGFDVSVRNPGRICTLYGSIKRKGIASLDRPHRRSEIEVPSQWKQVHKGSVMALAKLYGTKQVSGPHQEETSSGRFWSALKGDYSSLDVVSWFASHNAYRRHLVDNKHAVRCPWHDEHTTQSPQTGSDTIIYEADGGWPGFYCHHAHCAHRSIKAVMELWRDASQFCRREFAREEV